MTVLLVNPNSNAETTAAMLGIARAAEPSLAIEAATASFGPRMIVDAAGLSVAAEAVAEIVRGIDRRVAGMIVAAFGDPGLDAARQHLDRQNLDCAVCGIGEASFLEAAVAGRRFAVATTTPDLVAAIEARVDAAGVYDQFVGTFLTEGPLAALMQDADRLFLALREATARAATAGAEAVIIGGGPLAIAARRLRQDLGVAIVEPVPAAARLIRERIAARHRSG